MNGIKGRYYSESILTAGVDEDLVETLETSLGISITTIQKLTLISADEFHVNVNGVGSSDVYLDTDTRYKLSLDAADVLVSSLVVAEAGVTIFTAVVF